MAVVVGLAWLLADAKDLLSSTERLARVDAGPWLTLDVFRIDDVRWAFQITPWSAWWGIVLAGVTSALGWHAHRTGQALPFGWLSGLAWFATLLVIFADDLLVAFWLLSLQALLGGIWLAMQGRDSEAERGVRNYLRAVLVGDTIGLWGVLLAGLAWGTLEFASLTDAEFIQEGYRSRPASCGLAGMCLVLGVLGHGLLFPFSGATRVVRLVSGPGNALFFGLCLWPGVAWFLLRLQPLLGCAPETVSLAQGLDLIAAVGAAFLATAESDPRRRVALLATSQLAIWLAVLVIPGVAPQTLFAAAIGALILATVFLFVSCDGKNSAIATGLAWWVLAGGCLSPMFWLSAHAAETVRQQTVVEQASLEEELMPASDEVIRVRPLPVPTWTAAWCLWSFCAALAAGRGWRCRATAEHVDERMLPTGLLVVTLAATAFAASFVIPHWTAEQSWPMAAAAVVSICGGFWSLRKTDPGHRPASLWSQLAEQELYVPQLRGLLRALLAGIAAFAQGVESQALPGVGKTFAGYVAEPLVSAVEELRSEPAPFYAVALTLTIGGLLVTWMLLPG